MSIKRFLYIVAIVICSFGSVSFAQTTQPAIPVAEVSIRGANIADQLGNVLSISFTFSNGVGVQNGVKYGVRLTSKDKPNVVIDEKVYEETLTLGENSTINRSVVYTAPTILSGTYDVYVVGNSAAGFPFGISRAGTITLTATSKGIELLPESCLLTTPDKKTHKLSEGIQINTADVLRLSCTAINHSVATAALLPDTATYSRSLYGSLAEQHGGDVVPVVLKANEKKLISFAIPTGTKPGPYVALTSLSFGGQESNSVRIAYGVVGAAVSIINVSTDKDQYQMGDTAKLSLLWAGGGTIDAATTITSSQRMTCGSSTEEISSNPQTIEVSISKRCVNPTITLELKDKNGAVLDTRTFSVQTTSASQAGKISTKTILLVVAAILAIILIAVFLNRRGKTPKTVLPALALVIALIIPFAKTHAYQYPLGGSGVIADVNITNVSNPGSTTYNQGDTIQVDGALYNYSNDPQTVSLTAITVGNSQVNLFPSPTFPIPLVIPPGQTTGLTQQFTVNVPNPGTYNVTFTGGVEETNNGNTCQAYVRFVGQFRFGGVIWLGPAQHPEVRVTVALVGNLANGTTTNEPPDYETFIIPQNASQSTMGEFYAVAGFDHGWVESTDLPWVCGDATQNYRDGGQQCDYTHACYNNKSCIDPDTGYRITSPAFTGECPVACRYPNGPEKPFIYHPLYNSAYCPAP